MSININTFLLPFLTAGALGYINVYLLSKIDAMYLTKEDRDEKIIFLLLFSVINYSIYEIVIFFLERVESVTFISIPLAVLITLFLTTVFSFTIFNRISIIIKSTIDKIRKSNDLPEVETRTVLDYYNNNVNNIKEIYIFDFDDRLQFAGKPYRWSTSSENDLTILSVPFNAPNKRNTIGEVMEYIESEQVDSDVFINVDKKIKIIYILE